MNLILLFETDFIKPGKTVCLTGRRLKHVLSVHRAQKGDTLKAGLLNGGIGHATITAISENSLEMETVLTDCPPPPVPLTLLLALPRPKTLRRVIQCATAIGVKRFILMRSWRVEKSYFSSPALSNDMLMEQFVLGLEQGCDTIMPRIEIRKLFKPFVEDELPGIISGTRALLAHPDEHRSCPFDIRTPATLAIGPEGGFIQYEIDSFLRQGFEPVSLGPRPLRVEDAVAAMLGRLY